MERLLKSNTERVKIGCDIHARQLAVSIQEDDARPLRPQMMLREQLLSVVKGLVKAGRRVEVCYETGPCGYGLHEDLIKAGVSSYVIAAEVLGDGRRQKTDKLDAAALCDKLDRYVRGNTKAMRPVRVPSVEEQKRRSVCRLRGQLKSSRHQWEARGRSLMLFYDHHVTGKWWSASRWEALVKTLPDWLVEMLATMRAMILQLDEQEKALRKKLESEAPEWLPKAFGALTWVALAREICNWARFKNRRQVSSYTGLCPGVHQSGGRQLCPSSSAKADWWFGGSVI